MLYMLPLLLPAQGRDSVALLDNVSRAYHVREDGSLSSMVERQRPGNQGIAVAWDAEGKEIFREDIMHGSINQSVRFRYFPDGSVRTAQLTRHPDGGIQHYEATWYFRQDGTLDRKGEREDPGFGSPDIFDRGGTRPPKPDPAQVKPPVPPVVAQPAPVVQTKEVYVYLVNHYKKPLKVQVRDRGVAEPPILDRMYEIEKGAEIQLLHVQDCELGKNLIDKVDARFVGLPPKKAQKLIVIQKVEGTQEGGHTIERLYLRIYDRKKAPAS